MGRYGKFQSENFKTLLLLQIAAESFQRFPEFSSQRSSLIKIFKIEILTNFISFR